MLKSTIMKLWNKTEKTWTMAVGTDCALLAVAIMIFDIVNHTIIKSDMVEFVTSVAMTITIVVTIFIVPVIAYVEHYIETNYERKTKHGA